MRKIRERAKAEAGILRDPRGIAERIEIVLSWWEATDNELARAVYSIEVVVLAERLKEVMEK